MGSGKRKYKKREKYVPKNKFIDAKNINKKKESHTKTDPVEWFKKFKKDTGKEEKEEIKIVEEARKTVNKQTGKKAKHF